jgi:hypothetical protein
MNQHGERVAGPKHPIRVGRCAWCEAVLDSADSGVCQSCVPKALLAVTARLAQRASA